ncbi:hypothetical protein [Candidatus Thiosymbion oneisti]|uniref:hypothetical protein n=2 Tax=Candidatus Thiosymbion oneisti TaxID=589554 RepID=UPI00105E0224|nr:hypothetical protein [Candidatus Thiosymbion oneisti]
MGTIPLPPMNPFAGCVMSARLQEPSHQWRLLSSCRSGFDAAPNNPCPTPRESMLQEFMPEAWEQDEVPEIRQEQWDALEQDAVERYVERTAKEVEQRMRKEQPVLTDDYGETLHADITEAVRATERLGVDEEDPIYDWCLVRIASGLPFYAMDEFADVLNHPFLSPFAKARHIIMAFFAAVERQGKAR